jgi:hypothetical protein
MGRRAGLCRPQDARKHQRFGHRTMRGWALLFIAQQTEGRPWHCSGEKVTVPRKKKVNIPTHFGQNLYKHLKENNFDRVKSDKLSPQFDHFSRDMALGVC